MKKSDIPFESKTRNRIFTMFIMGITSLIGCSPESPPPKPAETPQSTPPVSQIVEELRESDSPSPEMSPNVSQGTNVTKGTIYRPSAQSSVPEQQLASRGYQRYASKHLVLYTDIEKETAEDLVRMVDKEYDAWVRDFGELPAASDGSDFQMTGYLMRDKTAPMQLALIPPEYLGMRTGGHKGSQFWMLDQETDYYRRHLLLHEATHCFMTIMPDTRLPKWYLEGMAELVATHRIDEQGELIFRVLPEDKENFAGWGRIVTIQNEVSEGRLKSIAEIRAIVRIDPVQEVRDYAWSWALCYFLDTHPRYQERFRSLNNHWRSGGFSREFDRLFADDMPELNLEWQLFVTSLMEGFDLPRSVVEFHPDSGGSTAFIDAGKGWQTTGWPIVSGQSYRVSATGHVTLANDPKPWISEPQGITLQYFAGQPIGRLVGRVLDSENSTISDTINLGRERTWTAPQSGVLFLRVNDAWNSLENNQESYQVRLESP